MMNSIKGDKLMIHIIALICSNIVTLLSIYTALQYAGDVYVLFHMSIFAFGVIGTILSSKRLLTEINIWRIK